MCHWIKWNPEKWYDFSDVSPVIAKGGWELIVFPFLVSFYPRLLLFISVSGIFNLVSMEGNEIIKEVLIMYSSRE